MSKKIFRRNIICVENNSFPMYTARRRCAILRKTVAKLNILDFAFVLLI